VSTHWPPQDVSPAGHTQAPITQAVPPAQTTPQAPQWRSSREVSTQLPSQAERPAGHSVAHCPVLHTWPVAQALLQAPQWARSPAVSTQRPSQRVDPTGHTQLPPEQVAPPAQAVPQAPQ
jgi:hypothetical protein